MIPPTYRPPFGLPLRWQDEQTVLPDAVKAFFAHGLDTNEPFTQEQFGLVCDYCLYYVNAPCWNFESEEAYHQLLELQASIQTVHSAQELMDWIRRCLEIGLDPL